MSQYDPPYRSKSAQVRGRQSEKEGLAALDADVDRILEKRRWLLAHR